MQPEPPDIAADLNREAEAAGEVLLLSGPIDIARGICVEIRLIGRSVRREDVERVQDYLYVLAEAFPTPSTPEEKPTEVNLDDGN